jgi:hypothetical protein
VTDLFVMVRDDPRVWRLVSYDDLNLRLRSLDGLELETPKSLCCVGEVKHWCGSRRFGAAWLAGGGELFMRNAGAA